MTNTIYSLLSRSSVLLILLLMAAVATGESQPTLFALDPARSSVEFTLADVLHTVHGRFQLKRGSLELDRESGKLSGEIVVDATSGDTGSGMRDQKMHKEVLESDRYPEISFRPDRLEGSVAAQGKSSVRVQGMFSIHGIDRHIMVPADLDIADHHWSARAHFTVPYEKWGMKNPSRLFLRVSDSVEIDLLIAGNIAPAGTAQPPATRDSPQ
jgi:polyisoprenoid-binding protein YceI